MERNYKLSSIWFDSARLLLSYSPFPVWHPDNSQQYFPRALHLCKWWVIFHHERSHRPSHHSPTFLSTPRMYTVYRKKSPPQFIRGTSSGHLGEISKLIITQRLGPLLIRRVCLNFLSISKISLRVNDDPTNCCVFSGAFDVTELTSVT